MKSRPRSTDPAPETFAFIFRQARDNANSTTMDWDERAESTHHKQCLEWFKTFRLGKNRIPEWVSAYRNNHVCEIVDQSCGSFNWCCKVRFQDGLTWMVRFAVAGKAMDRDGKLRREVAIMSLVKEKTTIPVPTVHAWGLSAENPLELGPFIIMDFIEGHSLRDLWQQQPSPAIGRTLRHDIDDRNLRIVYRQLCKYLLELAELEFPQIGSLALGKNNSICVHETPLTLKMQEIEAHGGVSVGRESTHLSLDGHRKADPLRVENGPKCFSSATEYFSYVADQDLEHLQKQPNSVDNAEDARAKYIFRNLFKSAIPLFVCPEHDTSTSRVLNDDLRFGNILVTSPSDLTIVAILDWEWTYCAPYQMFYSPPRWLLMRNPIQWSTPEQDRYDQLLRVFLEELEAVETLNKGSRGLGDKERLSELMRRSMGDGKFWFHELIHECFEGAENLAWRALRNLRPEIDELPRVPEPEVENFVEQKMKQLERYKAELASSAMQ